MFSSLYTFIQTTHQMLRTTRQLAILFIILTSVLSPFFTHAVTFRQHPAILHSFNDETFRRSTSRGNWLIFFHDSADQTIVLDEIPENTGDIRFASMSIRQAHETMRRFHIHRIPSFLCLRHGTHYYHYSSPAHHPYIWSALIDYCSHPPLQDAHEFPPPLSLWERNADSSQRE